MTNTEFDFLLKQVFEDITELSKIKGKEYTQEDNRLSNFYAQAVLNYEKPLASVRGNWSKHVVSIFDMLHETIKNNEKYPLEKWKEKLYDNILYSILCLAMLMDMEKHANMVQED